MPSHECSVLSVLHKSGVGLHPETYGPRILRLADCLKPQLGCYSELKILVNVQDVVQWRQSTQVRVANV